MAEVVVAQRMWQRRDSAANWESVNPILADGEIGVERGATPSDPQMFKIGNGVSTWTQLEYAGGGGGGSVWHSGAAVPSPALGEDDDFYLRTTNGDVYQKAAGAWAVVVNIMGEDGAEVEMRVDGGYVQWKLSDSATWVNLIAVNDMRGPRGDPGDSGPPGPPGPSSSCFPTASFDGGSGEIYVGSWCEIFVPFGFDVTRWTMTAQPPGNVSVDVRVAPLSAYPPQPTDSICGTNAPAILGDNIAQDAELLGWGASLPSGSVIRFQVIACVGVTRATLVLEGVRT